MTWSSAKDKDQFQTIFMTLLNKVSNSLAIYLGQQLPTLFEDWWYEAVLNILSFQQRRRVKERGINSLTALDLAALLRVLDQNWYRISIKLKLTSESRHFVKEMQTIRNRWAHAGTDGFPVDDVYRDLDTLQRFAAVIDADKKFINEVQAAKASLLSDRNPEPDKDGDLEQQPNKRIKDNSAELKPGQIVFLKSDPSIKGAVVAV